MAVDLARARVGDQEQGGEPVSGTQVGEVAPLDLARTLRLRVGPFVRAGRKVAVWVPRRLSLGATLVWMGGDRSWSGREYRAVAVGKLGRVSVWTFRGEEKEAVGDSVPGGSVPPFGGCRERKKS